ncbi:MAG TPA: tetratricopeptide repeat protein [Kofleriaceae bacterium]|nr:tetratricopeptide repeat protein [Kofleriaceae bacterium]
MRAALVFGLALAVAGCGARRAPDDPLAGLARGQDAPYDLAEDQDLAAMRSQLVAMPPGAAERPALRRRLAGEYARRISLALSLNHHGDAYRALSNLMRLWTPEELRDPAAVGRAIAPHRAAVARARTVFARAGKDRETAAALCALAMIEPERATAHRAELDELFAFADQLAVAEHGDGAVGARPIAILEELVELHPAPWLVDRLVALYVERQKQLDAHFQKHSADLSVIRAHGDGVVRTTWHIVRVLARAGRLAEAPAAYAPVAGMGDDKELRDRVRRALAPGATAPDWVMVAARFHSSDPEKADFAAALAIAREATRRFPSSPAAFLAAAESARQLGEAPLAIRLYETGLRLDPDHADAARTLAQLQVDRIAELASSDRTAAAARAFTRFESFHRAASKQIGRRLEPDRADALAALGRGLASQGEIEQARRYLERSIAERPTLTALESLGTIEAKRDRFDRAGDLFERAVKLPSDEPLDRYQQCKLLRLLGEARLDEGESELGKARLRAALVAWHKLSQQVELPDVLLAESLVEQGKILWRLGDRETALVAFDAAVDSDPDGASSHADVVAFLIVRNEYERAVDAYHRALGSRSIGDYFKVYMSLWVMAEARRQGRAVDPIARDFLARRNGRLWYDDLARFAGGRIDLPRLQSRATTRGRRAELLYYTAVLGGDVRADPGRARRLLEKVVSTDMVMFFEYDMAKHWLRNGFGRKR